jgi:hypothetical protein
MDYSLIVHGSPQLSYRTLMWLNFHQLWQLPLMLTGDSQYISRKEIISSHLCCPSFFAFLLILLDSSLIPIHFRACSVNLPWMFLEICKACPITSRVFCFRNPPSSHTCDICDFFTILSSLCPSSLTCHRPSVWLSLALDHYSWSVPFGWIYWRWLAGSCLWEAYFSMSVSWGLKPICSVAYHWWCSILEFLRWQSRI